MLYFSLSLSPSQAENHFECYVRYCTNQIYQTRELHDCMYVTLSNIQYYFPKLENFDSLPIALVIQREQCDVS